MSPYRTDREWVKLACNAYNIISKAQVPIGDKKWHGKPRKHKPSSSNSDSMTNGGANAVTIRNTERARADKPFMENKTWKTHFENYILNKRVIVIIINSGDNDTTLTRYNDITPRPNNRIQTYTGTRHNTDASPFRRPVAAIVWC